MIDKNLCNVEWYELEIANVQTEMGNHSPDSEEYDTLLKRLEILSDKVLEIEKLKLEGERIDANKRHDAAEYVSGRRRMIFDGVKMVFSGAVTFLGIGAITSFEEEHSITTKAWNIVSNLFKSRG